MVYFLLVLNFALLLIFSGFAGNWKLFDFFWSGGAVVCGALLLRERPVRVHVLGFFLVPAILVLWIPGVYTHVAVQNVSWWLITFFLAVLIPTCADNDRLPKVLFETVRWCGAALTLLYALQRVMDIPISGFGFARSAEAQILLGAVACCLFRPMGEGTNGRKLKVAWMAVLVMGIYLNGSRSAWLGFGILLLGYCWIRKADKRMTLGIAAAVGVVVAVMSVWRMELDPHGELRPQIFLQAIQIFCEFPFGSGCGTFLTESLSRSFAVIDPGYLSQYAKVNNHAHNIFLQWAAEGGIPGLATALSVIACSWVLIVQKRRRQPGGWPLEAAVVWSPALVLELMIGVSESLSPIRWMGLAGIVALTAEYSVIVLNRPPLALRLGLMVLGSAMLFAGANDIFARQAIRIGIVQEDQNRPEDAYESFQEAHRRRPWDEQPLLHMAKASLRSGRFDLMAAAVEKGLELDEGPGAVRYHGSALYREWLSEKGYDSDSADFQKCRYLMFSVNDLQPYDVPMYLDGAGLSRSRSEKIWRLRRALSLEPRAAGAYSELARMAEEAGDFRRAEMFEDLSRGILQVYMPGIYRGAAEFTSFNRNVSRYELELLRHRP